MSVGELLELYLKEQLIGKPSEPVARRIVRQFFQPWVARDAASLTKADVYTFHAGHRTTRAHADKALTVLKAAYNHAIRLERFTGPNPTAGIRRHGSPKRFRRMHVDEWTRLRPVLALANPKHELYVLIIVLNGKRASEPCWMRWDSIDWLRATWLNYRTKNGMPEVVPLPLQVIPKLQKMPRVGPWVFPGQNPNNPWHPSSARQAYAKIRRRAGIVGGPFGLWLHDLRRSVSSDLSDDGVNAQTVQTILNHSTLAQTTRYIVPSIEPARQAIQARADHLLSV